MPRGEVAKENVTQEVADKNQTDWKGLYTVKKGINDTFQGRAPSLLALFYYRDRLSVRN